MDVEYIRLLHDIHTDDIQGHLYRGYTIVGSKTAEHSIQEMENYLGTTRPIWFVFSGMGSQWSGMGTHHIIFYHINTEIIIFYIAYALILNFYIGNIGIDLMRFPVFAKAIQNCDNVLRPRGVDIINILTNKDKSIFDNILNSFVGIAAVQVS